MNDQKVVGVSLVGRVGALAVTLAMLFSAMAIVVPSNVRAVEPADSSMPMMASIPPDEALELLGPWIVGNITVNDGSFPESVTIKFTNQRTGENAIDIARNANYMFDLSNLTRGYEVGDSITIEALENTGNGKINSGYAMTTITANNKTWADILLMDPPPYEPEPIEPQPTPPLLGNGTNDNTTYTEPVLITPSEPGFQIPVPQYNITLADITIPSGSIVKVGSDVEMEITLGNIGDMSGDASYISRLSNVVGEIDSLYSNTSNNGIKVLLRQAKDNTQEAISHAQEREYPHSFIDAGVAVIILDVIEKRGIDTSEIMFGMTDAIREKVETVLLYGESIYSPDNVHMKVARNQYNVGVTKEDAGKYSQAITKYTVAFIEILIENKYTVTVDVINVNPDGSEVFLETITLSKVGIGTEDTGKISWTPTQAGENTIKVVMHYTEGGYNIDTTNRIGAWVISSIAEIVYIKNGVIQGNPEHHHTVFVIDGDLIIGSGGPFTTLTLNGATSEAGIVMKNTGVPDGQNKIEIKSDGTLNLLNGGYIHISLDYHRYRFEVRGTLNVDGTNIGVNEERSVIEKMYGDITDLSQPAGIQMFSTSTVTIQNNAIVRHGATHNICILNGAHPSVTNSNILNSGDYNAGHGMVIETGATPTILGNTFGSNSNYGLYIASNTQNLLITGNVFSSNYVGLNSTNSNTVIQGNTVTGNKFGIEVWGTVTPTITGNTVNNNVGSDVKEGVGIYVSTSSPVITANTIESNKYGIYFLGDSTTTVTNNPSIKLNTEAGIYLMSSHGSSIKTNPSIVNNKYGVYLAASGSTIDDNTISSNTLDGIYGTIYSGTASNPLIRGNTIRLNQQNGIFINQATATIENNIINGHTNGAGVRVQQSTSSITIQTNPAYSATRQTISLNNALGAEIYLINTQGSLINNLLPGGAYYGIYISQSSPTISQNEVRGYNYGGGKGIGIYLDGSSPTINNNQIKYNRKGIQLATGSSPTINDNTFTNNDFGVYSDYGPIGGQIIHNSFINSWAGVTFWAIQQGPQIKDNTFTSSRISIYLFYSWAYIVGNSITGSSDPAGAGIYIRGRSHSTISHNIIQSHAGFGIWADMEGYLSQAVFITNTITHNGYGIYIRNTPAPTTQTNVYEVNAFSDGTTVKPISFTTSGQPSEPTFIRLPKNAKILGSTIDTSIKPRFEYQTIIANTGAPPYGVTSADFDRDGDVDLITGDGDGQIDYYSNAGNGIFTHQNMIADVGWHAYRFATADFNLDGNIDFMVRDMYGDVKYFRNDGTPTDGPGAFTYLGIKLTGVDGGITSGDFDGDGDPDILAGYHDGHIAYYTNDGTGQFTYRNDVGNIQTNAWAYGLTVGDYNNDGRLDFLVGDVGGGVTYFENAGCPKDSPGVFVNQGFVGQAGPLNQMNEAFGPTSADFDLDGDIDYLVGNMWGNIYYYMNTGGGTFRGQGIIANVGTQDALGLTSADFDGDGYKEFISGDFLGNVKYYDNTINYQITVNLDIDVNNIASWTLSSATTQKTIDDSNTNPPFSTAIQNYLSGATTNPVDVPINFDSSTYGTIELSNLHILYTLGDNSIILGNDISNNNNVGVELHNAHTDIYDNIIDSNYYIGIGVYDGSMPIIDRNIISRTPSITGFDFKGVDVGTNSIPTITGNSISSHGVGVFSMDSSPTVDSNPHIDNNNFGIYCAESTVLINDNDLTSNWANVFLSWNYPNIAGCTGTVSNNRLSGGILGVREDNSAVDIISNTITVENGIVIYFSTAQVTVAGNTINIVGSPINPPRGIAVGASSCTISGNTITGSNWGSGIFVGNVSTTSVLINNLNHITHFDNGIDLRYGASAVIDNNIITDNDFHGILGMTSGWFDIYTITHCDIHGNGGWGMYFVSVAPANAVTLEIDNPLLGINGLGKIHQEWAIVYVAGLIMDPYPSIQVPMHLRITELNGATVIYDADVLHERYTRIPVIEYELLNSGSSSADRVMHTPHTILATPLDGPYYLPVVTYPVYYGRDSNLFIEFTRVSDTSTILVPVPVPGFPTINYISFPVLDVKVGAQSLTKASDLWNAISTAGGNPSQIRMWVSGVGWTTYLGPGNPDFDLVPDCAYEITHTQPFGLAITGYLPGQRQIALHTGDNYIGWTCHHTPVTVTKFSTLLSPQNLNVMYRWDTNAQGWIVMNPSDYVYPGHAYKVVVTGDCTLTYSEVTL